MNKLLNLILCLGMATGLISCNRAGSTGTYTSQAVPVNVYKVMERPVVYDESFPATVVALKQVELRGEVSGYITGIFFKEGDPVTKGQKLYEIDRTTYLANYDQAKSNVEIAKANLGKAQRDADRYTTLHKQQAIAEQTYDDAITALTNAKLQVLSANAALEKATSDLNYSVIKAPFDGTIGISQVRIGTLVTPGQTLLNTISSDDPMGIDFQVNSEEIGKFQHLADEKFNPADSTFRISMPDNSIYPYSGKISIIDRAFDPQTGTITIRLTFPNKERELKPGMSCNVLVYNHFQKPQLVIPYLSVSEMMGEYFVFLVNGNKVTQTRVSLGQKVDADVIVDDGLKAGDIIVTDGIQKLHDGSVVQTGPDELSESKNPKK